MSDKNDYTNQPQEQLPTDEASRRPRYVPYSQLMDRYSSERSLYHAMPAQTTSLERTIPEIRFPFSRVSARHELPVMEPSLNTMPSYTRAYTPNYTYSPRQSLSAFPSASLPPQPPTTAVYSPELDIGRGASASGGPPPYWQHIGEPSLFCTSIREMTSLTAAGHRSMVPLPSVRDIFSTAADENERVVLPPIYMSPSIYCHMRDADPASAVDAGVGPRSRSRSRSKSPESASRSRGPETYPEPEPEHERERTPEEFATPALPGPSHVPRAPKKASVPVLEEPQVQVPGPSAELTEFVPVNAHTAKCDLCNKRNGQGMTRCVECGWQTCNACTVENNYFRSHRAGAVLHIGPVDKKKLPTAASVKKGKQAAKRKREDPDYVPEAERASKKKRASKSQVRMTGSTSKPSYSSFSSSSSHDGSPNEANFADLSEDETVMFAAQILYAMSREAFEMEAHARTRKFRQHWHYSLWVEDDCRDSRNGDDETELVGTDEEELDHSGPSSPLARCIPRLRRECLEIAMEEGEFYRRSQKMRQANGSAMALDGDGGKSESESKSEGDKAHERVKTRAQTYARKRCGL